MKAHYLSTVLLLITLSTFSLAPEAEAQYVKKILVKSGQAAPGTNGALFTTASWNAPTPIGISEAGDVLFKAALEDGVGDVTVDNNHGLWVYESQSDAVWLVYRPGDAVPGITGAVFTSYDSEHASMDLSGQIGLLATYLVGGITETAFFMSAQGPGGALERKVYEGLEILPDMPGVFISRLTPRAFNAGRLLFTGRIEGEGVNPNWDDLVVAMYQSTGISVIARAGDPMPIVGDGYINTNVTSNRHAPLDASGGTVVQIKGGKAGGFVDILAAYHWSPDTPILALALSSLHPSKISIGTTRMNSAGWLARRGSTEDLGWSLETVQSGPIGQAGWNTVVTQGDIAWDAGGDIFGMTSDFVVFENHQVALRIGLSGLGGGIWIGDESGLNKVAVIGDRAAGVDTSMRYTRVNYMMANRVGQVAFMDFVDNGFTGFDGIWVGNVEGVNPVSLELDTVETADGVFKTIEGHFAGHTWWTRTGADGYSALLNDSGKIAFGVSFYEGGNALLLGSPGGLVVNSIGDDPDADPADGRCGTGNWMPDGSPECTIRAAIMEANAQDGHNTITFNIDEDPVIEPLTALPGIRDSVLIDAFSQPGNSRVVLDGILAPVGTHGLVFDGEDITVQGLALGRFDGSGIFIRNSTLHAVGSNKLYGCYIGYISSSGLDFGNGEFGVYIKNSSDNIIGGAEDWQRNYITSNLQSGIRLDLVSLRNRLYNNYIGFTPDETNLGNGGSGVIIEFGSDSNYVGGGLDSGNVISGNALSGVEVDNSAFNIIRGNFIGNNTDGVVVHSSSLHNRILKNNIGVEESGLVNGNLGYGIQIKINSDSNFVGGGSDSGNVIAGNQRGGIAVVDSDHNIIGGNKVGLDPTGTFAVPNQGDGISVSGSAGTFIGLRPEGNDDFRSIPNTIAGNDSAGIAISNECQNTTIASNWIGVGTDGSTPVSNYWGITIFDSPRTLVGREGLSGIWGNRINENEAAGIMLWSDSCTIIANKVQHNGFVGNVPVPLSEGYGIYIDGSDNEIGTLERDLFKNMISSNSGIGIAIDNSDALANHHNRIYLNTIYENLAGGIDLWPAGPNPIDDPNPGSGPNDGQNAARLVSVTYTVDSMVILRGELSSRPNQRYVVHAYQNDECDPSGLGQGKWLGIIDSITTDNSGLSVFSISDGPWEYIPSQQWTVTVTDPLGNSSEFSNCLPIITSGVDLSITKTDLLDSVNLLDTMLYRIRVTNFGPDTARTVLVTDSIPLLTSYISDTISQGSSILSGDIFTCQLGDLAPGAVASIDILLRAEQIGSIVNYAYVSCASPESYLANNVDADTTEYYGIGTDISDRDSDLLPTTYGLSQNYPNPFNPATTIGYSLPAAGPVTLQIFNVLGQEIRSLINSEKPAGYHTVIWDGRDSGGEPVSSGVYLYRVTAGAFQQSRKMLLMK